VWVSLSLCSAIVSLLRQPTNRHAWLGEIILPLGVMAAVFAFGLDRLREPTPEAPVLRVTLIQPSIPQTMIWDEKENTNRFRQVLDLSERALTNGTDLLLWPEAALSQFDEASFIAITNLVAAHRVWMILGADEVQRRESAASKDDYDVFNSAFLFDPDGHFRSTYRKQKLVVFGEYVPLIRWLPFIKWFTPITGGFTAGDRPVPFKLERRVPARRDSASVTNRAELEFGAPIRISTLICFEDVFPHVVPEYVRDDTDFLVNLTNDGWFGEGAEQWQHAASATFRAVENGVPLVRCCNNGLTCWIDSRGAVRQFFHEPKGSVYGPGAMTAQIPLLPPGKKREPTFYNRHGDWFGWSCVAVMAVFLWPRVPMKFRRTRVE
jgi:apolipoprotein N-acyltransferase